MSVSSPQINKSFSLVGITTIQWDSFNTLFVILFSHQIYTDWANYYLERAKCKRKVTDLSTDCKDGLLLAEIIEAVTTFKVPDLVKKPKTAQQMVSFNYTLMQFSLEGIQSFMGHKSIKNTQQHQSSHSAHKFLTMRANLELCLQMHDVHCVQSVRKERHNICNGMN